MEIKGPGGNAGKTKVMRCQVSKGQVQNQENILVVFAESSLHISISP